MMWSKYVIPILITGILVLGALSYYLNGVIEDKLVEIGHLEVQSISLQASNKNLTKGLDKQNEAIDRFNIMLATKNKLLVDINSENAELQSKLQRSIFNIDSIHNETCEETLDWMLDEVLYEESINSTIP